VPRQQAVERCGTLALLHTLPFAGRHCADGMPSGAQDHLLPAEYVRTFRGALLDKCPVSSPTEVSAAGWAGCGSEDRCPSACC
jgi:hypothetical protein